MSTGSEETIQPMDIQDEMRNSYLTYAMSVIISRALPDVRDGLKPSQRRILVAMNDLNLGPTSGRVKCQKISGDTSGNYHPHSSEGVYTTLVRLAQDWNMRQVLVDKQGNFGSLAGLPPAAARYTEARLSAVATEMLDDIKRDTVDFVPTYDQTRLEPVVLPSRFPNLLVNGSNGIAVGMRTMIPPHNLSEVCEAVQLLIDAPEATMEDILECIQGPDFPTGGIICGHLGIRQAYMTGRSTIAVRARTHFEEEKNHEVIVVTEIPYLQTRDGIREKLEQCVREGRIDGISQIVDLTDRTLPSWQVRLHIVLKRDADREVVLNQLFNFSPLQTTLSVNLVALVGSRPKQLTLKEMLEEFLRHRVTVLRRRTEFLLSEARKRKHTVEGLLIAQINIDDVISTIRQSPDRKEACLRLQQLEVAAELIARALGEHGFRSFLQERHQGEEQPQANENYSLTAKQAEAIVSMQLGSLAGLEREKLGDEHRKLLEDIDEFLKLLSDEANLLAIVRDEMETLKTKYGDKRRTEVNNEEVGNVSKEELITEETMVVTLSHRGYIKRIGLDSYQAQHRGGKGIMGAKRDEEDPIEHLFVASTHDYLMFFTDRGKVYWQKVYDLPLGSRTAKGRALVNLVRLEPDEKIFHCLAVRHYDGERQLVLATRNGIVKKTALSAYGRPLKGGLIAVKLDEGDELIGVAVVGPGDDILIASADGKAIRFAQEDARSMGRNTRGVKAISLREGDYAVGMVVADPEANLLTICENGYGKRTPIGVVGNDDSEDEETDVSEEKENGEDTESEEVVRSSMQYRRQKRGGKGVIDIRTTARNGKVVAVAAVSEEDEVIMVTAQGKIQRVRVADISQVGRNTQGVRIIRMDEEDRLVSLARVPQEEIDDEGVEPPNIETPPGNDEEE